MERSHGYPGRNLAHKVYCPFAKPESALTFEKNLETITTNITTMGIEEQILQMTKAEGRAEGRSEGRIEGKTEEVRNLIIKLGLDDEKAADIAGVSIEFVQQVRAAIESELKN